MMREFESHFDGIFRIRNVFINLCLCCALFVRHVECVGFDRIIKLPQSRPARRSRAVCKRPSLFHVHDFGARGDGVTDDTKSFRDAWKIACSSAPQSTVVIPEGNTYLLHPIDFAGPCRSKVTLKISGNIIAPRDPEHWKGLNLRKWLYFHGVKYLTIEGGGTINGMGQEWWARSCKINATNPCKHAPNAVTFHRCKNLKVTNVTVINSQQMHMAFTNSIRVEASYINLFAPFTSPNTDGFHISASKGVKITDSIIRTGDDCISVVGNSSRIRIGNICCGPGHGISIGSLGKGNSWDEVRDVIVDSVFLSNTDNGVRIKTWQGGGGFANQISFQNIRMDNVSHPIIIDQYYCDSRFPCSNQSFAPKVENISFINIKGTSASKEAIEFSCSDGSPCEGLYLEDIQLESQLGVDTKSYCWNAYGSTSGLVHPPCCFEDMIMQRVPASSVLQSFLELLRTWRATWRAFLIQALYLVG